MVRVSMEDVLKGLPMEAIITEALKNAQEQGKNQNPNTGVNHDEVSEMKREVTLNAKFAKMQFDQFVAVGFTEAQAMELTIATINYLN